VTLLSRGTKYRRTLNEAELVARLEATGRFEVNLAAFSHHLPFTTQLQIVANTDILVSRELFLPFCSFIYFNFHFFNFPTVFFPLFLVFTEFCRLLFPIHKGKVKKAMLRLKG
jgi:hypothetical protein